MSVIETQQDESTAADLAEQQALRIAEIGTPAGLGWLRDLPDIRDYTTQDETVAPLLDQTAAPVAIDKSTVPSTADLRSWFSPIENQGNLGSCTANAGAGLVEYFERRAFGRHIDASRLFLYKATRDLMNVKGDTGAYLRTTMQALATFGIPPEKYWPYAITRFDLEPTAFCYAFAENYKAIQYYRLDPPGTSPQALLDRIRAAASSGLPSCFGFTVYSSITQAGSSGKIPFPAKGEQVKGGHAIDVAGYDDTIQIANATPGGPKTKGALLIRNSWGPTWGMGGYGWLPYDYVLKGLAADFWSLVKADWIDSGQFS